MAAIIDSVAPQATVTSRSGSTGRPHSAAFFSAMASRSTLAPQVVAYWWYSPPRASAAWAASTISAGGSKSGKPWAKLMARSGPWRARFTRVISRMTDSVNLEALALSPIVTSPSTDVTGVDAPAPDETARRSRPDNGQGPPARADRG